MKFALHFILNHLPELQDKWSKRLTGRAGLPACASHGGRDKSH
jgi:hypothetical protein